MQARFRTRPAAEWLGISERIDACVEPVLSLDAALGDAHVRARRMVVETTSPSSGKPTRMLGIPAKFSRMPGEIRWPGTAPGANGRATLESWGLSAAAIDTLVANGAVTLPRS